MNQEKNNNKISDNLFNKIFRNKNDTKETFKEIKREIQADNTSEINDLIKELLDRYPLTKDIEKIRLIIRSINACLNKDMGLEMLKSYGDILLELIISKDGNLRRLINSVMNSFRLRLIFNVMKAEEGKIDIKVGELASYNIDFYLRLAESYYQQEDDKIRKSILSSIKRFHCFVFGELISKTSYIKTYEEFNRILYLWN